MTTVYPLVLRLGPLSLTGYGLMMMAGFLMAGWAMQLDLRQRGFDEEYAADIVVAAVIGGLVGAKLWYVIVAGDLDALFRRGGFVWYGGLIGGVVAVLLNGWRLGVPARYTMEIAGAPLALGYAIGRVGCFLVNDDYGIPTSLPWGVKFPHGLPPSTVAELQRLNVTFPAGTDPNMVVAVHPTQIYETVLMFLVFVWLWQLRSHRHAVGWRFGVYLLLAAVERFLVEFVRAKDDRWLGPLSLAQLTSIAMVIAGVVVVVRLARPDAAPLPVPARFLPKKPAPAPAT
ncbi:MAG TPA: prolipoprotein diacylglyceryl transferase [Gemmatimonadales bacterium]|nr:prolipoprotein diacylglyceryl transferase [Gemmatimonadales bacterium]